MFHRKVSLVAIVTSAMVFIAIVGAEPVFNGWRGNGTGVWPDARPPLTWSRIPRGAMTGLRAQAGRPTDKQPGNAPLVKKGQLRDWLVLGPFSVKDSVRDLDSAILKKESAIEPTSNEKEGDRVWTSLTAPADDITVFGTAELPWLDLKKHFPIRPNQIAYAHTYLYSPAGGKVRIVIDHAHGLKAWVNGKEVYRSADRAMGLGFYSGLSRLELRHSVNPSPRFDFTLQPGWNRLLFKISSWNKEGSSEMRCSLRIMDAPGVRYESQNIRWMTSLPGRSTSTPILVGDRLFLMAEPDLLLCIDKLTGKILWTRSVNYYEALPPEDKRKQPAYATQIDPLIARLNKQTQWRKRVPLLGEIQNKLEKIDPKTFRVNGSSHFESHFGIVGYTMPTPVSDGKNVYVWTSLGVAACFDLAGKRQWITRLPADEINYGSSPALADGVLVVFLNGLFGLDAKTGKLRWEQPRVRYNTGSLIAATLAGKSVVVTQRGDVIRPADGERIFGERENTMPADTGWAPPVVLEDRVYSPKYGVTGLRIFDYGKVKETPWKPALISRVQMPGEVTRGPKGQWVDRWTAGSPLIHGGLIYQCDIYQWLYVNEVRTGKLVYRQAMDLRGLTHYNAVAVAASPTLIGKHLFLNDNQGTTLVLNSGRKYDVVSRNIIATQIDRLWPIPSQETIGYAPAVPDGDRLYLRGEAHLYCIAKEESKK